MRKLKDKELSLLGEEIAQDLTAAYLGDVDDTALLTSLGLLEDGHTVTKEGLKILSAYPFLGEGKGGRKHYPSFIFAFLLSLSQYLPSPVFNSTFFRKESFLKLFPSVEGETVPRMAYLTAKAMERLCLFTPDGLVNIDKVDDFMSLSLIDRISHILFTLTSGTREDIKKALSVITLIDGIESDKLDRIAASLKAYSSLRPDWELLFDLGLLYEENGLVYACDLSEDDSGDETYTLSSDYTITYSGREDTDIYLIAEPLMESRNTVQWLLTRASIKKAFDMGLSYDVIKEILDEYSSFPVPSSITDQIKSWEREYRMVRIVRGTVVIVDERYSSLFTLPGVKEHIIEKLGEKAYLMESEEISSWRNALTSYGVTMLGTVEGPEFAVEKKEEETRWAYNYICYSLCSFASIPPRRQIPYDEKAYNALLGAASDEWERLLVESHLVFSVSGIKAYSFVDGLEYNLKHALIQSAVKAGTGLVIKDLDDRYHFVIPIRLDGDILETDEGDIEVSKIWKVTSVMKDVIEKKKGGKSPGELSSSLDKE